jgi:hypothetical protein
MTFDFETPKKASPDHRGGIKMQAIFRDQIDLSADKFALSVERATKHGVLQR